MARNPARPLSPHLGIWKPGIHMVVSILNRVMGVGLATVGVMMFVWWLNAAANGADSYAYFMSWAKSWLGYVVFVGLTYVFFFHMLAGIRHFVMDVGAGFELKLNRSWAWATMVAPVLLNGLVWLIIMQKGL